MSGTGVRGVDHFVMGDEPSREEIELRRKLLQKIRDGEEITIEQTAEDRTGEGGGSELVIKNGDMGFTEEQLQALKEVRAELAEKRKLNDAGSQTDDNKKDDHQPMPMPEKSSKSRYLKYAIAAAIIAGGAMFLYQRSQKKKG